MAGKHAVESQTGKRRGEAERSRGRPQHGGGEPEQRRPDAVTAELYDGLYATLRD